MKADAVQIATRLSPLSGVIADGVVVAASYQPLEVLVPRLLARVPGVQVRVVTTRTSSVRQLVDAADRYDDGDVDAFLSLPVQQPGGDFMQQAWLAMRAIRGGTVASYAELAAMAGRPAAIRAAGTACASNLVAPLVPCHRVVRTGGSLGNYGFGEKLKRALLIHEGALEQGKSGGEQFALT
jgi:methylated-DNA-[protein]-cysteine S-methyltransferase